MRERESEKELERGRTRILKWGQNPVGLLISVPSLSEAGAQ